MATGSPPVRRRLNARVVYSAKHIRLSILRWHFTWIIAILPIFFHFGKQLLVHGEIDMTEICGRGELLLVAIVMLAEPLSRIFFTEQKRATHYIYIIFSLAFIMMCTYTYAVIDISPEFKLICKIGEEKYEKKPKNVENIQKGNFIQNNISNFDSVTENTSHLDTVSAIAKQDTYKTSQQSSETCCATAEKDNKQDEKDAEEDNNRLWRLVYLSIGTIIAAYVIGYNTLVYAHK